MAEKKMIETPVSPLMTTCVVDMGKAKMRTFTKIRAEHICVDPSTMKPSRRLLMFRTGIVFVTVYYSVNLDIVNMPIASKKVASATSLANLAFLLT